MARCCACGLTPAQADDLRVLPNKEGRWVTVCPSCLAKGVAAAALDPAEAAAPADADGGRAAASAPGDRAFANVGRVLGYLRAIRRKAELRGNRTRAHDRHSVDIPIRYRLTRDDTFHAGVIRDISQGGLRLFASRLLERGQHIHFDPDAALPAALAELLRGAAEVRRVTAVTDGRWDIGIRFVQRSMAKADNRRRHKRYQCAMRAYVIRPGSAVSLAAAVTDISQGGMQLRLDEAPEFDEELEVRVRGDAGSFIRGDLVGATRVRRVLPRGPEWEVGCMFAQTRVEARPIRAKAMTAILPSPAAVAAAAPKA